MNGQGDFELDLREQLAQDAEALRPGAVPYEAIVRRGRAERRRRLAVAGAALAVLAVVPATALAFSGDGPGDRPSERLSAAGGDSPTPGTAVRSPQARRPATAPATPGQLADGITHLEASLRLDQCIESSPQGAGGTGPGQRDLGLADDYRILLAHRSTGNDNSPGDGQYFVAVKDTPVPIRLICSVKDGKPTGLGTSVGEDGTPGTRAVRPDMNAGQLYRQRMSDEGPWKLPYRWGSIGTVDPRVARVTIDYGGTTVDAVLDHGWFAATGILERAVTEAPRIKGYDAQGKEIYDSDQDKFYDKPLP
ncbi:hypothetical protein [Streptomyces sp. NBC_01408]|uniref:hypothetical protein n=1 Tax=Streptomyces sp. NBC_01408 TaxID=2903855 RepID=UPI00224E0BA6|nr:hypothetical protein [Streptomyces sp. NBC_01408]MCX4693641.1 hypothetical protein [Streptomyces sp. NBC_01408]